MRLVAIGKESSTVIGHVTDGATVEDVVWVEWTCTEPGLEKLLAHEVMRALDHAGPRRSNPDHVEPTYLLHGTDIVRVENGIDGIVVGSVYPHEPHRRVGLEAVARALSALNRRIHAAVARDLGQTSPEGDL